MTNCELFRAEQLPVLQNKVFPTAAEAQTSATGDVVLVQDGRTGLVSNHAFDAAGLVYDRDYQNEQACSSVFRRHLDDVAAIVGRYFRGKPLIEIGCGKGYFLEHLIDMGFDLTGIDPAYEGTNLKVLKTHFHKALGLSADGIILRHVLEHIPDPVSFLADISRANAGTGALYIEVPCFDWILQHRAWFDIFYEHVNYFRLRDFFRMFNRVYESGHLFGGQYLFVVADLASLREPAADRIDRVGIPDDFLAGIGRAVSRAQSGNGRRTAVWGGGSKGVIFSLYMQRAGISIDKVIDINPAKHDRYLPVTGLKVYSPARALERLSRGDNIFVMNSNYLSEIQELSGNKYSYVAVNYDRV